eukprot:1495418-Amphidinium_carterae.1
MSQTHIPHWLGTRSCDDDNGEDVDDADDDDDDGDGDGDSDGGGVDGDDDRFCVLCSICKRVLGLRSGCSS